MIAKLLFLAFCSSIVALKINHEKFKDPQVASCGVVLAAFGTEKYISTGSKVAERIANLPVQKGWCPTDADSDKIPVALFTDREGLVCPSGVQCFSEKDMDPWTHEDRDTGEHFGTWKFQFYQAQVVAKSPFDHTLSLDLDAVPCSGDGISSLFNDAHQSGSEFSALIHTRRPCAFSKTKGEKEYDSKDFVDQTLAVDYYYDNDVNKRGCDMRKSPPANISQDELKQWSKFPERNVGVIIADMSKTRPMFVEWAKKIEETYTTSKGNQLAFRQAFFLWRDQINERPFNDNQVCRYKKKTSCATGCAIWHAKRALDDLHLDA